MFDDDFNVYFEFDGMRREKNDDHSDDTGQEKLEKTKSLREKVNWEVEDERREFFRQLYPIIDNWINELPDLRDIFQSDEIDWLLAEDIRTYNKSEFRGGSLIKFVIKTGYKDEPKLDKDGKPLLRRTTAVHCAGRRLCGTTIRDLFLLYDRFDVNYTDDTGLSHFHVACMRGCYDVIEKFLEAGQDPNCIWQETGDSPLHLAVKYDLKKVADKLLKSGADPNAANVDGSTPLHVICQRGCDDDSMEYFFEVNHELHNSVQIDARDKSGRTSLEWAVARLLPRTVDVLLDRGADLSAFIFPSEAQFKRSLEVFESQEHELKLNRACRFLIIVERLEKRGYDLDRSDALTIMKEFSKLGLFYESVDLEKYLRSDEEFVARSKNINMNSSVSLYDLIQYRPDEARRLLTYSDYSNFVRMNYLWFFYKESVRQTCVAHLCETMSRGFFRRWTLELLLSLTRYQLPIICCEKIIDMLMNEDLTRICLAADIVEIEQNQNI